MKRLAKTQKIACSALSSNFWTDSKIFWAKKAFIKMEMCLTSNREARIQIVYTNLIHLKYNALHDLKSKPMLYLFYIKVCRRKQRNLEKKWIKTYFIHIHTHSTQGFITHLRSFFILYFFSFCFAIVASHSLLYINLS